MTIVDDLTPITYKPVRIVIEIRPDETLTNDSLSFFTDVKILNANGNVLGTDHPTPNTNETQTTAFRTWLENNLAAYETLIGLSRYTE